MTTTIKYASLELGTVEAVFNKLGGLEGAQRFLRGDYEVVIKTHTINCDADPMVPENWSVEEHIKGGQLRWNPDEVNLYLCNEQKGGSIQGNKLRKKLQGKPVLNANVLDYLLANPQLISEGWKGKFVFFWGTIYRGSDGYRYVRYLDWDGGRWRWYYRWLGRGFREGHPASVRASST